MKNRTILLLLFMFAFVSLYAQSGEVDMNDLRHLMHQRNKQKNENVVKKKEPVADKSVVADQDVVSKTIFSSYVSVGYSGMDMKLPGIGTLKSYYGVMFNIGHTYFFDEDAMIGLDVSWLDLNYNNYKLNFIEGDLVESVDYHKGDVSLQAGPLFRFSLIGNLDLKLYAKYAPSYTFLYDENDFYSSFVSYFTFGAKLTYKHFGIGFEYRTGEGEFNGLVDEDAKDVKTEHRGWNVSMNFDF